MPLNFVSLTNDLDSNYRYTLELKKKKTKKYFSFISSKL